MTNFSGWPNQYFGEKGNAEYQGSLSLSCAHGIVLRNVHIDTQNINILTCCVNIWRVNWKCIHWWKWNGVIQHVEYCINQNMEKRTLLDANWAPYSYSMRFQTACRSSLTVQQLHLLVVSDLHDGSNSIKHDNYYPCFHTQIHYVIGIRAVNYILKRKRVHFSRHVIGHKTRKKAARKQSASTRASRTFAILACFTKQVYVWRIMKIIRNAYTDMHCSHRRVRSLACKPWHNREVGMSILRWRNEHYLNSATSQTIKQYSYETPCFVPIHCLRPA